MAITAVTMPRMWKLRDLRTEGGVSSDDLLLEINDVTFATATTATVATAFANGQILGVFFGKQSATAVQYSTDKVVSSSAITITSTVTNCAETITVIVIGKMQV